MPGYAAQIASPKAAVALVERACAMIGTPVPRSELSGQADDYEAQVAGLIGITLAHHGWIDIAVNCQGITILKPAEEFTPEDWDAIVGINLRSVFFACQEEGRHMLARGRGAIINIASASSYRGWARSAVYAATKAGVVNLTETLASEWAGRGVRVNAIAPGFFMTEPNQSWAAKHPKLFEMYKDQIPLGDFGRAEDLGPLAVYLASDASRYVTGAAITIDGGYTLW